MILINDNMKVFHLETHTLLSISKRKDRKWANRDTEHYGKSNDLHFQLPEET